MPMYDFQCRACQHAFEAIARIDEVPACPSCRSADTERLLSAPAIGGKDVNISYKLPRDHKKGR